MRELGLLAIALIMAPNAGPVQAQVEEEIGSAEINFTPLGQTLRFQGEIIPRPDLTVEVVASMWGIIYREEGGQEGAKVEKDQPLARTVLERPALERLPLDDRTLEIEQYLEVAKQRARLAMDDYQRAVEISKENPHDAAALNNAFSAFNRYLQKFPGSDESKAAFATRDDLREKLAESYFNKAQFYDKIAGKPRAALLAYRELLTHFPTSKWTEKANSRIAFLSESGNE